MSHPPCHFIPSYPQPSATAPQIAGALCARLLASERFFVPSFVSFATTSVWTKQASSLDSPHTTPRGKVHNPGARFAALGVPIRFNCEKRRRYLVASGTWDGKFPRSGCELTVVEVLCGSIVLQFLSGEYFLGRCRNREPFCWKHRGAMEKPKHRHIRGRSRSHLQRTASPTGTTECHQETIY